MKKSKAIIAVLLCLSTIQLAKGQAQIGLGLKGGWNFASLSGVGSVSNATKNKSGFNAGAYALIKLTKIGIQPEVIFSQQGESYSNGTSTYGSIVDYINIPVMIKLYLIEGLHLQAGPQLGFVTSATGSLNNHTTGAITSDQDLSDYINTTDFSIGVGLGCDFPRGFNLTMRYNIGITDLNKYTNGTPPNNTYTWMGTDTSKNLVLQLSVGYRIFKIGR